MSFWNSLKNFKRQVDEVEHSVYRANRSLMEIYELNARLEAEISLKTKELNTANRQMVTLQHIWDMMNSSKPLSSVLNAVVNNLQGELGYLHSCIVKKITEDGNNYLQILACSDELLNDFKNHFNEDPFDMKLNISSTIGPFVEDRREIIHSQDLFDIIKGTLPDLSDDRIHAVLKSSRVRSYIVAPLMYQNEHFGSLVVFSSRLNTSDSELNFLKLFSKQIELAITVANLFQLVKEQATTDSMTGLYNRRYFEECIKKEAERSYRQHHPFTIIGLDLDHLKEINDKYGHNYGDIAIKSIAEVIKNSCRSIDVAARMGGEEFNIILPGIDTQGGLVVAERIRQSIADLEIEKIGKITASFGVGTYNEHSEDIDELLELVDHAMYESKCMGRNRVSIARKMDSISWQEVAVNTFIDILSKHRIPVDNETTELLCNKLEGMNINNEALYQVSDMLVSTYNPQNKAGITKKKIILATTLAKRFDLSKESTDNLKIAILLYDIGNTMVPKKLLSKKSPLTKEEISKIKEHPIIAAREILEPISTITDVIPIIEKHHENWNGTGYPNKISKEEIPIESQIILIVDSYYALMEKRPYRPAFTKEEAINQITSEAELKWSKKLSDEFVKIIEEDNI